MMNQNHIDLVSLIHGEIPGRSRLRIHGLKNSPILRNFLESTLPTLKGLKTAKASDLTGNILIFFDSNMKLSKIIMRITNLLIEGKKNNYFQEQEKGAAAQFFLTPWYNKRIKEVLAIFRTSKETGLTSTEAKIRIKKYGLNSFLAEEKRSSLLIFAKQFKSFQNLVLIGISGISFLSGGKIDAFVILGIVAINVTLSFLTELQVEKAIHSLKVQVPQECYVLRNGNTEKIPSNFLVPGDILLLSRGQTIPVDGRIIISKGLTLDEALLTGESTPIMKQAKHLDQENLLLGECTNMVFRGTTITGGNGKIVVVATGRETELGRIYKMMGGAKEQETPMQVQMEVLGKKLIVLSGSFCVAIFLIGLTRGYPFLKMLQSVVSLAVASIPEGLPAVATTALALGVKRLKAKEILVRHLPALEALAFVDTICFDKTGTLTENKMKVSAYYVDDRLMTHKDHQQFSDPLVKRLLEISSLNHEVVITPNGEILGPSTEKALVNEALAFGLAPQELQRKFPLIKVYQRTEQDLTMRTVHTLPDGQILITIKGDPIQVLQKCDRILTTFSNNNQGRKRTVFRKLVDSNKEKIIFKNAEMAAKAMRILGLAYTRISHEEFTKLNGKAVSVKFIWVGLVGLIDVLKKNIVRFIEQLHGAGFRTIMITGDQKNTAYAIGEKLHLANEGELTIMDAQELKRNGMSTSLEELAKNVDRYHIFSRVSPTQKMLIIKALQAKGRRVVMVGDGHNDGPALKVADVGIAMGEKGTGVSQDVADILLMNNDPVSLLEAIRQGRTITQDISKALEYVMATNASELFLMAISLVLKKGNPLNPMQLLWINLLTDLLPQLALGLEPTGSDMFEFENDEVESSSYREKTNGRHNNIKELLIKNNDFSWIGIEAILMAVGPFITYLHSLSVSPDHNAKKSSTLAFFSLATTQLLHTISSRSQDWNIYDSLHSLIKKDNLPKNFKKLPQNPYITWSLIVGGIIELSTLSFRQLREILSISKLTARDFIPVLNGAVMPFLIIEAIKFKRGRI